MSIEKCPVLVVGGAGFLGSHLVDYLVASRGCSVVVMDNLVTGKREWVDWLPGVTFIHHDICGSEEFIEKVIRRYSIEWVFNYAAWPYIPDSFDRPLQVFAVNATGAIKVINAAASCDVKGILQVSSGELYGDGESGQLINEKHPVAPRSTYGAAKAAVDYYCQTAWMERKIRVIALRQFNCVGERETHPYVIPEIISRIHNNTEPFTKTATISLGNNSIRDFMYAGDAVRYAVWLLESKRWGEVFNLGSSQFISIYDLANMVGEVMGLKELKIKKSRKLTRPWEIWSLRSDNSKIEEAIKEPVRTLTVRQSIERAYEYFKQNGNKWDYED